jgi:hypothetical protein
MKIQITYNDYLKAIRKGYRDNELEDSTGWVCKNKTHKNLKQYKREKINIYNYENN